MSDTRQYLAVDFIAKHGCRAMVLSGGEPTLLANLPQLLRYAKGLGLHTVVSTNGLLLEPLLREVAPHLDWIALPIDACDSRINDAMRWGGVDHLQHILALIARIRRDFPQLRIKLGTVVTRLNKDHICNIPDLFAEECRPDVWKIYEMSFSNYGKDNRVDLELGRAEFEATINRARMVASRVGLRVVVYRNSERDGKYVFVDPDGGAKVIVRGDEMDVGNIFREPNGVLKNIKKWVSFTRVQDNYRSTYL